MGNHPVEIEGFVDVSQVLRSGVYVLVHRGVVIYIGKSKTFLNRIYAHRSLWGRKRRGNLPDWMPVKGILFDEVFIRPCPLDLLDELESAMIDLYKPKYNTKLKAPGPTSQPFTIRVGTSAITFNQREPIARRI